MAERHGKGLSSSRADGATALVDLLGVRGGGGGREELIWIVLVKVMCVGGLLNI